jgi:hypothetical protein
MKKGFLWAFCDEKYRITTSPIDFFLSTGPYWCIIEERKL